MSDDNHPIEAAGATPVEPAEPDSDEDLSPSPSRPVSSRPRKGIALCLSGGGFRATIFHLGALRRLNELGILSQVNTFSCVSGGSITGAHFARWVYDGHVAVNGVYANWHDFEAKLLRFVMTDIRTWSVIEQFKFC